MTKKELQDLSKTFAKGVRVDGWSQYTSKCRRLNAFYNKDLGIVIKRPTFILDKRTPLEVRVPTTKLGDGWVAQPVVEKTNLKLACSVIRKKLKKYPTIYPDVHSGNVGWHNKKPVLFDW